MLSVLKRSAYVSYPRLAKRLNLSCQQVGVRTFSRGPNRDSSSRTKEPIIIEIIDNKEKFKEQKEKKEAQAEVMRHKNPLSGVFNFVQATAGKISNVFFPDEETRMKNRMKDEVNKKIDEAFKGRSGIFRGILKQGMKLVGGRMVTQLVEMQQAHLKLSETVEDMLSRDAQTKKLIGYPVELSDTISMAAEMESDGTPTPKGSQVLTYQVLGSRGSGVLAVTADPYQGGEWTIKKMQMRSDNGIVFDVTLTTKPDKDHIIDV